MFVVALINSGFLEASYISINRDEALRLAEKIHKDFYNEDNDGGYVAIEMQTSQKEPNERIFQIDLDEEWSDAKDRIEHVQKK